MKKYLSSLLLVTFLTLAPSSRAHAERVEIFVTSWCAYCRALEQTLKENDIHYTRYDIEKDPHAAEAYRAMRIRGIPITRIGKTIITGYDPYAIFERLGIKPKAKRSGTTVESS